MSVRCDRARGVMLFTSSITKLATGSQNFVRLKKQGHGNQVGFELGLSECRSDAHTILCSIGRAPVAQ